MSDLPPFSRPGLGYGPGSSPASLSTSPLLTLSMCGGLGRAGSSITFAELLQTGGGRGMTITVKWSEGCYSCCLTLKWCML